MNYKKEQIFLLVNKFRKSPITGFAGRVVGLPRRIGFTAAAFSMTFCSAACLSAKNSELTHHAWELVVQLRFNDAFDYFSRNIKDNTESDELDIRNMHLGQALSLLNKNPKTNTNTRRAISMLESLAGEDPKDETGLTARYLLARAHLFHLTPASTEDAMTKYEGIIRDKPEHIIAQISVVKLAMLRIYGENNGKTKLEVIKSIEAMSSLLKDSALVRDFHLLLGNAYMYFDLSPEKALHHLIKAERIGIAGPVSSSETCIQIAELANSIGNFHIANSYYKSFVEKYPRDIRSYTVTQKITELNKISNSDQ